MMCWATALYASLLAVRNIPVSIAADVPFPRGARCGSLVCKVQAVSSGSTGSGGDNAGAGTTFWIGGDGDGFAGKLRVIALFDGGNEGIQNQARNDV